MQIIKREPPEKERLVDAFMNLKLSTEAIKLPKSRKNSVYATISRLKKDKKLLFTTAIEGANILIWRIK